ncbi:hypothetical protein [Streptomyces sp. NPDC058307]
MSYAKPRSGGVPEEPSGFGWKVPTTVWPVIEVTLLETPLS